MQIQKKKNIFDVRLDWLDFNNKRMGIWQLQEAKNKFSKLVEEAISHGPQIVTRHGVESVVVISKKEYAKLSRKKKSLMEVLKSAPVVELDISRNKETIREVKF